ncbi:cupin domain-containing protein [Roseateles sp. So40a]|uniref:cupin domain-containing protein n=1 Tax=Roseateles sp. So40a TaxID=3400226 RepID=UPI003A84BD81
MTYHLRAFVPSRPFRSVLSVLAVACFATLATGVIATDACAAPPPPKVAELMTKSLSNLPGQEVLMLTVEYPPGGADPVHRHDAHGFIYVLEGSIVMGVKGGKEVTLTPGQTFYEGPADIHTVGRNASKTKPAKFVVFLVKKQGVDAVLPAH